LSRDNKKKKFEKKKKSYEDKLSLTAVKVSLNSWFLFSRIITF